jgi:hypothetical protein
MASMGSVLTSGRPADSRLSRVEASAAIDVWPHIRLDET